MPRIEIRDPFGMCYRIDARDMETIERWFAEILPHAWQPMTSGAPEECAKISVFPMTSWNNPNDQDSWDWVANSSVTGHLYSFRAKTGSDGMRELARLRQRLERQVALMEEHGARAVHAGRFEGFPVT